MFMSSCRRKLRSGVSVQRSTCTGKVTMATAGSPFTKWLIQALSHTHLYTLTHIPGRGSCHSTWRTRCYGAEHVAFKIKAAYGGLSLSIFI